jgi:phage shock protein C
MGTTSSPSEQIGTEPYGTLAAEPRRLRRSRQDRVLAGVCGGLGRYLDLDPVVLRILTVALIFTGVGIPAYIIAWIAIPEAAEDEPEPPAPPISRARVALTLGIGLIVLGGLLVARTVVPWFDSSLFWPLVVVGGGLLLVLTARR